MTQVQESDRAERADWPIHRCSIPIPRVENPIPKAFCDVTAAKRQRRRAKSNTGIIAERARRGLPTTERMIRQNVLYIVLVFAFE